VHNSKQLGSNGLSTKDDYLQVGCLAPSYTKTKQKNALIISMFQMWCYQTKKSSNTNFTTTVETVKLFMDSHTH